VHQAGAGGGNMNDELQKELAGLAAKLGVSVEHLWGVLVRQAYIDLQG